MGTGPLKHLWEDRVGKLEQACRCSGSINGTAMLTWGILGRQQSGGGSCTGVHRRAKFMGRGGMASTEIASSPEKPRAWVGWS